jgi:hypothetical protein
MFIYSSHMKHLLHGEYLMKYSENVCLQLSFETLFTVKYKR